MLYGITGSGKTEVYMNAVRDILLQGKSVIILAPEIILASQLAMRFAERFGAENVALWHSSISEGERHDVWKRLLNNEIRIVVGARSAIFAPVKDLGLIIIDEEHDPATSRRLLRPGTTQKPLRWKEQNGKAQSLFSERQRLT